jgi:LacI family transcriptional regulator
MAGGDDERGDRARRPTLSDVARLAAVSPATVSRVINEHPGVRDDTRREVEGAIATLRYRPSFLGRNLALRSTRTIGVLISDIRNPFFPEIVYAVEREARRRGYLPILCDVEDARPDDHLQRLLDQGVDGLLVASTATDQLLELRRSGPPIVLVNQGHPAFTDTFVLPDYRAGGALATAHLVGLGHQRIAHVRGPLEVHASVERERGYLEELDRAGLDFARSVPVPDFSPEAGRAAAHELMRLPEPPTGMFVVNDYCSLGVLHGLADAGLRVPEDVSVVGYDDIWPARLASIDLTTVSAQIAEMARAGTDMLVDLIESGRDRAEATVLPPELMVRGTTGPPPR